MNNRRESEALIGLSVMVHPNLTTDPASMQGEVGKVIADNGDHIVVAFPEDIEGKYTYDAVLALRPYHQLLEYLLDFYEQLSGTHKKAILKMMKLQAEGKQRQALSMLTLFPNLVPHCTHFYSDVKESAKQIKGK